MTAPKRVALNDVAVIERDIVDPTAIASGTLYVGLENIESGGRFVGVRPVDAGELASSKFAFTPQHLLYGKLRPYLAKIARPDFEGICSTDILPVLPGPDLDRGYLAWLLLTPEMVALASSRATGANLPRLSPNALAELKIPLPPLPEQRRIAEILDKADALRAKRRAALAQLDTLTQSIFLAMFGDPVTNPKRWASETIGEVADQVTDGEHLTPRRATAGIKLLSARNIRDGYLDFDNVDYIDSDEYERISRRCDPAVGDVLVSCSGTIGRVASVETTERFSLVRSAALIRPDRTRLDYKFLEYYLRTPTMKARMLRRANASSQANLFQGQIRELPVYLPPLRFQREFADRVASTGNVRACERESLAQLDSLFASLQHRAFQGEL
jgi:type I restriction enzyme S subunit